MNKRALNIVIVIVGLLSWQAYALVTGYQAAVQLSDASVQAKQTELLGEQAAVKSKHSTLMEAKKLGEQSKQFIEAWSSYFPAYSRISEEMSEHLKRNGIQVKNHDRMSENEAIKFNGREFRAERRGYEFAGRYSGVVNYIGAFQQTFELIGIDQLKLSRKGDVTNCELIYLRPNFESFSK